MTQLPEAEPITGRELRRLTRQATEAHGGGAVSELFNEVYTIVFSLLIALMMVFGATRMLSAELRTSTADAVLEPAWLGIIAAVVATGAALSLAGRLGPVGLGGGHAAWWLPTPVDRRGLLLPRLLVVAALAVAVGAVLGALAGLLSGTGGIDLVMTTVLGASVGLAGVLTVAVTQIGRSGRRAHPTVLIGEALVMVAPVLALGAVLLDIAAPQPLPIPIAVAVAAALGAVGIVLLLITQRRLDGISGAQLRARGEVTAYAAGAATALDTRELGRALSITSQPDARRRSGSFAWVRGPISALVTGDALVTLRSRRHVLAIIVWALVPVVITLAGWASWAALVGMLIAGYGTALATTEGARRAEMAPVLDRSFGVGANHVRRIRSLWPMGVLAVWTALTLGVWAAMTGLPVGPWMLLAVVAGPVFALGALRGAYRKPADWSQPLVSNPMGPPIPPGLFSTFSKGPDITVICSIPLILGMIAVASPATLLPWQVATTLIAFAIGTRVPNPKGAFAQAMGAQR